MLGGLTARLFAMQLTGNRRVPRRRPRRLFPQASRS